MASVTTFVRRQLPGIVALLLLTTMFAVARLPEASAGDRERLAGSHRFTPLSIDIPGGFRQQTIRRVNKDYERISAWISAVGAAIAMNDLDGDGLDNDLCLVDSRIDKVVVAPTPGAGQDRYESFVLDPSPLPMNDHIAPMGCVPGDFNADGRLDLLVYWWGRTPVVFLARAGATALSSAAFRPAELVSGRTAGTYDGPQWNTNAVAVADFDGDGHEDVYVGNFFPDGPVLDDTVSGDVAMPRSLSRAFNGGPDHILRWVSATAGAEPTVSFAAADGVFGDEVSRGWTLAAAAHDLDGDLLPELYVANDFGPDRLLHNRSTPGNIRLALADARGGTAVVPKSKRLGNDSFKGMGVDFGDFDGNGLYDVYVGNITTSFGIQESNFAFVNTAKDRADLRRRLTDGEAPFDDRSAPLGLAWSGWSWDVKFADFTNSGDPAVVQTSGFIKGEVNRWAQLQELATANDALVEHPRWWPRVEEGDDIAGGQHLAFHLRDEDGRYEDVSEQLGMDAPVPSRGVALGDADGDGRLDLAIAHQFDAPVFYRNDSRTEGTYLNLRIVHDNAPPPGGQATGALRPSGSPVVGTQVTVTTPDGRTLLSRVDGGSGHSGKRTTAVMIGLGDVSGPVDVRLAWRDRSGGAHEQTLRLAPGRHILQLGSQAREVTP